MADDTLYQTTAPSQGSVALAHERLIRVKQGGVFINITGDVNNLAFNPSPVTVNREVYGTKGQQSQDTIAHNFAPTFQVEVVRDPDTHQIVTAQAWVKDLVAAAYSKGAANKREFQLFTDARDGDMPVFQGTFSIAVAEANTGYADKGVLSFTLTSDGVVEQITSPIAGDGKPIVESALPALAEVGDQIVIRGYNMTGTTGITIDGKPATNFIVVDENTIVVEIPADVTGAAAIVVTNTAGAGESFDYTAASA